MTRGFAIKKGRFYREMKRRGLVYKGEPDMKAFANQIGMDKSTTWRVMNQKMNAGPAFVDNVMEAWGLEFHDLFGPIQTKKRKPRTKSTAP